MSPWLWILTWVGSFLAFSLLAALAVGAILGGISRGVSELHESEMWTAAPLTRAAAAGENDEAASETQRVAAR
jgi:hypothetical protein